MTDCHAGLFCSKWPSKAVRDCSCSRGLRDFRFHRKLHENLIACMHFVQKTVVCSGQQWSAGVSSGQQRSAAVSSGQQPAVVSSGRQQRSAASGQQPAVSSQQSAASGQQPAVSSGQQRSAASAAVCQKDLLRTFVQKTPQTAALLQRSAGGIYRTHLCGKRWVLQTAAGGGGNSQPRIKIACYIPIHGGVWRFHASNRKPVQSVIGFHVKADSCCAQTTAVSV
jgi:hypothetical protein